MNKKYSNFAFLLLVVSLSGCLTRKIIASDESLCKYSNQVIINEILKYKAQAILEGRTRFVCIDTTLAYRPVILPYFPFVEKYGVLLDSCPAINCPLTIPDSLHNMCLNWDRGTTAALTDTSEIILYSPLLPTKQKNVFALQSYHFVSDTYRKNRVGYMVMDVYRISRNGLEKLEPLESDANMTVWPQK